ncbi:hypothetical protein HK105_204017 [Polyrhizophydium stewartii]|uniref:Ankyrin repeat protein n=1 Tax=Polyrhizophydium stewartii TaxID=2732419 RepID=A0ABR4NAP6_9FUNG
MVLDWAGALTQLASGLLLRAELRSRPRELERVWRDALECDWPGDLATLPAVQRHGDCFLAIRTRAMFQRVERAHVAEQWTLQRVAIANRWLDLLHLNRPRDLAFAAAFQGAVWLLEVLVDVHRAVRPSSWLVVSAAHGGHLDAVKWFHARMRDEPWSTGVMDSAAGSGNLDLVVWLHENRPEGCTTTAMYNAAGAGHLHIVRWLAGNRAEGCSVEAVKWAAYNGHLDVLEFLGERFPAVLRQLPTMLPGLAATVQVLQWLHAHDPIRDPAQTLASQIHIGSQRGAQWLCATFGIAVSHEMLAKASAGRHAALAKWMLTQPGIGVDRAAVAAAVKACATDVLTAFVRHDPRALGMVAAAVVERGDMDLVEWLHVRHPACMQPRLLDAAVASGQPRVAEYLLTRVEGVKWDIQRARAANMAHKRRDIAEALDEHAVRRSPQPF